MKLLFKQRLFSWFDSYDIYDEEGNAAFIVKGRLSWGHRLEIFNGKGEYLGQIKEEIISFMPRFSLYQGENYFGSIRKKFTFLKPVFTLDCNGWRIEGDWLEWNYRIADSTGQPVAYISKEVLNWSDTYALDIGDSRDALRCLMIVLAIDAAKCSN